MKFDYCRNLSADKGYVPIFHFQYTLSIDEVQKALHKYGYSLEWMTIFDYSPTDHPHKIRSSLGIIQDALCDKNVDLGTNYKEKYEELVELLKPHKIDDDMSPTTTLKMILRYHK